MRNKTSSQQILMILVKVSGEGMPEGMTGKAVGPAEFAFRLRDMTAHKFGSDRL